MQENVSVDITSAAASSAGIVIGRLIAKKSILADYSGLLHVEVYVTGRTLTIVEFRMSR